MPIINFEQAVQLKNSGKACLCLDLGEKRIGVAKSDAGWSMASPLKVMDNKKFSVLAEEINNIIIENEIVLVVIGLPLNADGTPSRKSQSVQQFGRNLQKIYDINIIFEDERFSTKVSHRSLEEFDLTEGQKKKFIDKVAAAHILQNFLDKIR